MDTQDQQPEVMRPDSTVIPPEPELSAMIQDATIALLSDKESPPVQPKEKSRTPLQDSLRRLRRDKRAMVSLGVIMFFVVLAIIGPPIYQHIGGPYNSPLNGTIGPEQYHSFGYEEIDRQDELPSAQYWLGTDDLGRDILARLMQGMLISITVAVMVEIVDIVLGIFVGVLAGYYGGWIDQLLARFTDIMFAFQLVQYCGHRLYAGYLQHDYRRGRN